MYRPSRCLWTTALFVCLMLLVAPAPHAHAAPRSAAYATAERGDVEYQRGGVGPFLPLRLHAFLAPGDVVRTGTDGEAELLFLDDGSSVKVSTRTTLRITVGAANAAVENKSLLQVIVGVLWAHLRPGTDIGTPAHVNTVTRGTEILLDVADDGATTLTVLEGSATFSNPQGTQELVASQQSVARPGQAPTPPVAMDRSGLIAWTANVAALPLEFELPALTPGSNGPRDFPADATRWEAAVRANPNDAAAWVSLGQARRGLGDLIGALAAFAQAETLAPDNPDNADARVGMALTYLSQGKPDQARAVLAPVQSQPMAEAVLGLADLHEGKAADAEQTLQAALTQDPKLFQARALLALAFLSRDDLPDAEKAARQAAQDQPNSAQTQGTLSLVLFFAGQTRAAEAASRRAVKLNPLSPFALLTEGRALLAQQQTDDARTAYEKAASFAPNLPLVHQELGAVYQRLDMPRKAAEEYQIALNLDPGSADSHTGLGLALQSQGRYAKAEADHKQALALDPDNVTAIYNLASLYIDRGRLDEARLLLERGVQTDPQRGILYARLAEILLYRQDLFGAQQYARRAVSLLPDSALTHYELGRVYLEQERTTQAEQEFREATLLDRQFAAARYALGLTQEKNESGLLDAFASIPASALVGSPGSAKALNNLQTPGADQRIQAALLDPSVVRSASRTYGDTELDATFGDQNTHDVIASYLNETGDGRGVRGVNGEDQRTDGPRPNADSKLDTASVVLGQKAAANASGYFLQGDYQETDSGLDAGVTSDPSAASFRFHSQQPRLLAGVDIQSGERSRLRVLLQGSTAERSEVDTSEEFFYTHFHVRSFDGEIRWDAQINEKNLFSAGLSTGTRRVQGETITPPDLALTPDRTLLVNQAQPFQYYLRDELQVSRRLSIIGQMQVLSHEEYTFSMPPVAYADADPVDFPTMRDSHRTTLGVPTAILNYRADPRTIIRLRARRLAATIQDFQLLTPTDVFLLSYSGLPETVSFSPVADGSSVELEADHTFPNASFLSLAAFQQDLHQADFTGVGDGPYPNARVQGVQVSYEGLLGRDLSFLLTTDLDRARDTQMHERISQVPDYTGLASLQYLDRRGYYAQAAYYYQGNRRLEDTYTDDNGNLVDDPTRLGGFGLLNLRVGRRLGLRVNVFGEVDNVFNRQYDIFNALQPGRQYRVGVSLRF